MKAVVTSMKLYTKRRPRPRVGDTKMIKGVLHIRQLATVVDYLSGKRCVLMNNGRPSYEWVKA